MVGEVTLDRVRRRFEQAIATSYDANELLGTFWAYIYPLLEFEYAALPAAEETDWKSATAGIMKNLLCSANSPENKAGPSELMRAAEFFQKEGLHDLATLFRRLSASLSDRLDEPLEPSHCHFELHQLKCEGCGYSAPYLTWRSINTALRPEMEQRATSGEFCEGPQCLKCAAALEPTPFFYCNPDREEFIVYWPFEEEEELDEWIQNCMHYIDGLPTKFKAGKTDLYVIRGMPIALYAEAFAGAITVIQYKDEFIATTSEPVYFDSESFDIHDMNAYFRGKQAASKGAWKAAARAFAEAFLLNQGAVSRLDMLSASLKNLGRYDEAKLIDTERERLRDRLLSERVIQRIFRPNGPSGVNINAQLQILKEGLPASWGFSSLTELAKKLQADT
jgi:hypothetical protein